MPIAGWVRDRVWRAESWCAELAQLRPLATTPARVADLAAATEECDPDRGRALALYLDAWRGGHAAAREPAKALAQALGAHLTLAELAKASGDLVAAGAAFLDAGFPELAVDPLTRHADARPAGASTASENLRLAGVRALLAFARREPVDTDREIADAMTRAQAASGRAAAAAYAHAARIARLANAPDRLPAIVAAAARACPGDAEIAALVEARLLEIGDADQLLDHYRGWFEQAPSRAEYVARVRAAGIVLITRDVQPGLGLRLVRMSLEHAYADGISGDVSHVAAWELVCAHAKAQDSTVELVPLIVRAIESPLSDDAAVYLARLGLEIAWRDAADTLAAQPYAATLLDFVPEHPLALAFEREVGPIGGDEPEPEPTPPPAPPPAPSAAPAPAPAATTIQNRTTARIPVFDQGQVKRSVVPPSQASAEKDKRVTGRLALLTPPPPRATALKRNTSPFPIRKREATAPPRPRAPRTVMPIDVVVELPDGNFFSTVLRDVSTSGAFIVTKRALEVGTIVSLELRIPTPRAMAQASHRVNARIARRSNMGCGLAFIDASPQLVAAIRAYE